MTDLPYNQRYIDELYDKVVTKAQALTTGERDYVRDFNPALIAKDAALRTTQETPASAPTKTPATKTRKRTIGDLSDEEFATLLGGLTQKAVTAAAAQHARDLAALKAEYTHAIAGLRLDHDRELTWLRDQLVALEATVATRDDHVPD